MKRNFGILLIWSLLVVAFGEAIGQTLTIERELPITDPWITGTNIISTITPGWGNQSYTLETRSQGIDILNTSINADTLVVEMDEWKYNYGGPNVTCAVLGCTSDHMDHKRKRIYINLKTSKVIRNEVGRLQDVKKEVTTKDWIYKLEK
jgi:hypothetical protein